VNEDEGTVPREAAKRGAAALSRMIVASGKVGSVWSRDERTLSKVRARRERKRDRDRVDARHFRKQLTERG